MESMFTFHPTFTDQRDAIVRVVIQSPSVQEPLRLRDPHQSRLRQIRYGRLTEEYDNRQSVQLQRRIHPTVEEGAPPAQERPREDGGAQSVSVSVSS